MDIVTGVGVLDKAMTILGAIEPAPLSLSELQASTGLPRATAHRLATALEAHGLLRRDDEGRFELGPHLVTLGRAATGRFALIAAATPVLRTLRDATGESVQLFVREGDARRCVISLESPHGLRWIVPEGSLLPLEFGSSGRVLLGETPRQGWVESVGEREPGVASVSAPIVDGARVVVAAISVSGPIERLSRTPGKRFGRAVADAAARIDAGTVR
jgi:DNA-binding IclR family transcriptional regulator